MVVVVAVTTATVTAATMVIAAVVSVEEAIENSHAPDSLSCNVLELDAAAGSPNRWTPTKAVKAAAMSAL